MSLIARYLNQTAKWQAFLQSDEYGAPEFAEPKIIQCRHQVRHELYITSHGDTRVATSVYYVSEPVKAGDMIDGAIVSAVNAMVDFSGSVQGYKVIV